MWLWAPRTLYYLSDRHKQNIPADNLVPEVRLDCTIDRRRAAVGKYCFRLIPARRTDNSGDIDYYSDYIVLRRTEEVLVFLSVTAEAYNYFSLLNRVCKTDMPADIDYYPDCMFFRRTAVSALTSESEAAVGRYRHCLCFARSARSPADKHYAADRILRYKPEEAVLVFLVPDIGFSRRFPAHRRDTRPADID